MSQDLLERLGQLTPGQRRAAIAALSVEHRIALAQMVQAMRDNPWLKWQKDPVGFVQSALGETIWSKQVQILESVRDHKRTSVAAGHAPGKALGLLTPVPTPTGWRPHGHLRAGDEVFDEAGQACRVVAVGPVEMLPSYRVHFADGSNVVAAGPHEWKVQTRRGKIRTMETAAMVDCWRPNGATRAAKYAVPVAAPLSLPEVDLPVEPYLLGYWLGDGDSVRPHITVHRKDLPELLAQIAEPTAIPPSREGETTVTVSIKGGLHVRLRDLGMYRAKRAPGAYLRASEGQRWALLAGLMDSDGWAQETEACFVSTQEGLARDVLELARSLGEKPTLRSRPAMLGDKQCGTAWRVSWCPMRRSPFRLARKSAALTPLLTRKAGRRAVVQVEPVGVLAVSCIQVDSPSSLYLAGEAMVPTHNSHIAARAAAQWVTCYPPGTAQVVTTATTFRQVRNIMWPHIRRLQARHGLPGETSQVEWKIGLELAAYGFSAESNNEAALQGIHFPNLLIIVDEAGGISHTLGQAMEALMTGDNTRLLVIGNPPTDEEGTWFEKTTTSPLYNHIVISAFDTPNFTGEDPGLCAACPTGVAPHSVGNHLVDESWVDDVRYEFGEDSPFYIARVLAQFPRSTANKVIPFSWVERATITATDPPPVPGIIRLGCDIASDGGDEMSIGVADGMHCYTRFTSVGKDNENAVEVAGVILDGIRWAEAEHARRGISDRVKVKIDALGVGWGVVGILQKWGTEEKHGAKIIAVKVSERARSPEKFSNQRAEMWWCGRQAFQAVPQPDGSTGPAHSIAEDKKLLAQLAGPKYSADSGGKIVIEKKKDMRSRGIPSPDRAEAVLLALYEPPGPFTDTVAPVSITKTNTFIIR